MKNPGWIDLQVNGHNGVDFSNPELTADMVIKACEELFAAGTEIFLPTIITGPMELYRRNIPIIKKGSIRLSPIQHFICNYPCK